MDTNRDMLLKEIMAVDFSIEDIHLYLNTHPYDKNALNLFNNYVQRSQILRCNYERMYGPLTAHSSYSGYPWQWIQPPWPWQNQANPQV